MKIHIEIVTGFLGAGKTSFINSLLNESQVEGERVLIFQLEHGEKNIEKSNKLVKVIPIFDIKKLKEEMIFSIKNYNPNRVIIEYNGTTDLGELLEILNRKIYKQFCKITTIFFIADGKILKQYIDSVGVFIVPFIQHANMIVINNIDYSNKKNLEEGFRIIRNINPKAYVLKVNNKYILNSALKESRVIDNGYVKKIKIKLANSKMLFNKL